ncbi:hypothetical protein J2T17_004442 [Paenibacillus mucilaginosus]|uniref:hypothetical protein n=1 Tax=Paenibacillus mucilaginosus TaxID=61624 RepID=UPI003D20859C
MNWEDLSKEAKSILEWVVHVWTGEPQELIIEKGKDFVQPLKFNGDVVVPVTATLFEEIKSWLPYAKDKVYMFDGDTIRVYPGMEDAFIHEASQRIQRRQQLHEHS